jgi:hypothetical protein
VTCDHQDSSLRYLENADAVAELLQRGVNPALIDLVQSQHPEDDADIHVCDACNELLFLMPDENDPDSELRQVWCITDKGKGQ